MAKYQIKGTTKRACLEEIIPLQTPFRVMLEASFKDENEKVRFFDIYFNRAVKK
jgi:hypothetical protein